MHVCKHSVPRFSTTQHTVVSRERVHTQSYFEMYYEDTMCHIGMKKKSLFVLMVQDSLFTSMQELVTNGSQE